MFSSNDVRHVPCGALRSMRRTDLRIPLAVAFFVALSGACGGGDDGDGVPAETATVPGPSVPQPPLPRRRTAEGEVTITDASGGETSVTLLSKVEGSSVYSGRESGFDLEMACGDTVARVDVELYFARGDRILRIERQRDRWAVDGRAAEVVPSRPTSSDAAVENDAGAGDGGDTGDAGDAGDATPPIDPELVNGLGFPAADGSREVFVTLVASGVRYDVSATIPWRASIAPATCTETKPGTGTRSSGGGGCGGGSRSGRRSSGGDWD